MEATMSDPVFAGAQTPQRSELSDVNDLSPRVNVTLRNE